MFIPPDNPYASQNAYTGEVGNNAFGGGSTDTILGFGVLVLAIIIIVLILLVRRKFILGPLMFGLFLLPCGQTFVVGGVHLYVCRILIAVALVRAIILQRSRVPHSKFVSTSIDKLFFLWIVSRASIYALRYGDMGAVVNQIGFLWDALGGYFVLRLLIDDEEGSLRLIKILSVITVILSITMLYEKLYDVNLYGLLTRAPIIPEIRNGNIRAQGPFHHAILAGTFGATLLPLLIWLWKSTKTRFLCAAAVVASAVITVTAASSTPATTYLAAILAVGLWPLRRIMRLIRWGLVVGIVMLNFSMHAPVWWAIEHIDLAGGSAGEHRAELIDNFVNHFGDWWLIGTSDNASWGYEMWDQSNQYVAEGEAGGLATFICFIAVVCLGFKWTGKSRKWSAGRHNELFFWLLGAALFSHTFAFFGISYFDQTRYSFYALLAIISVTTSSTATQAAMAGAEVHPRDTARLVAPALS